MFSFAMYSLQLIKFDINRMLGNFAKCGNKVAKNIRAVFVFPPICFLSYGYFPLLCYCELKLKKSTFKNAPAQLISEL